MFYVIILLLSNFMAFAADAPKVGDLVPAEVAKKLFPEFNNDTKSGELVLVQSHLDYWKWAVFSATHGKDEDKQISVFNEKNHGLLFPVEEVRSLASLQKSGLNSGQ